MHIFCTDQFVLPLPAGHRFPVRKYAALRERVAVMAAAHMRIAPAATDAELAFVHDLAYIAAVSSGTLDAAAMRRIGFPWSEEMVERSRRSVGATIAACRSALARGCGASLAGGTHHAHRGFGEGFCVFNDVAVAARAMQAVAHVTRVLIVDLDVHQGDGTASLFADDASVFTFSMHGRNNFPFRKTSSDLDVELDDRTPDGLYLHTLATALEIVLRRSQPDLAIYLAGADPYVGDRLGKLALSKAGLATRDAFVLDALREAHVPVAIVMGGGYAADLADVVDIHCNTISAALERFGAHARLQPPKPRLRARTPSPPAEAQ